MFGEHTAFLHTMSEPHALPSVSAVPGRQAWPVAPLSLTAPHVSVPLQKPVPHSFGPRRQGDPVALVADVSRIKAQLEWTPRHSDLANLIRTAAHWQANKLY